MWASTHTEQQTTPAMLPSLYRFKVGGLLHIELYAAVFIILSNLDKIRHTNVQIYAVTDALSILIPRPSLTPVFDHLQYAKMEFRFCILQAIKTGSKTGAGEGVGMRLLMYRCTNLYSLLIVKFVHLE